MAAEIITKEDLREFKVELIKEFTSIIQNKTPQQKTILKSAGVRKMLGISAGSLQTLRINGLLPFTKLNGTLYYEYDDVIEALNKNKTNNMVK